MTIPNKTSAVLYCQDFSPKAVDITAAIVLCSLIAFVGSLGNAITILVIKRAPNLQTICGVLIANLALADLLVTAISIPLMILVLSQDVVPVCSVSTVGVTSMVTLRCSITASVLILAAMSMDRCWAICSPISHKLKMSTSKLKAFLGLIWLTSLVFSALELYSRFERLFSLYIRTFGAVTCLLAIVISGIVTFTTVRFKSSKIRQLHDSQSHMKISGELREREKQVAKTVALIVGLFCLCWVPIITIPVRHSQSTTACGTSGLVYLLFPTLRSILAYIFTGKGITGMHLKKWCCLCTMDWQDKNSVSTCTGPKQR